MTQTRKVGQNELEEQARGVVFLSPMEDPSKAQRRGHAEEQILAALRQAGTGTTVAEICREVRISEQTHYEWKRIYSGLGLSELRKLKRLVADLSLDQYMFQEIVRKKL